MIKAARRLTVALAIAVALAHPAAAADAPAAQTQAATDFVTAVAKDVIAAQTQAATDFVTAVAKDVIATFGGKTLTRPERARLFHDTILRVSSPRLVAEAVLGRYWSSLSEADQTPFAQLLVDYVVAAWSESLSNVSAETRVEMRGTASAGDRTVVRTVVSEPGEEPGVVDWTVVVPPGGKAVLADITAGGVSVVKTMRADFAAVLHANDGRLAALTDALRRKIAQSAS